MAMYVNEVPSHSCIPMNDLVLRGWYFVLLKNHTFPQLRIRLSNQINEEIGEYHFGSIIESFVPMLDVDLHRRHMMKNPLSISEKMDSKIRIKVINFLPSVNIYLRNGEDDINELLMQLNEGEESYLQCAHGTALVATVDDQNQVMVRGIVDDDGINDEQYVMQQVVSSFKIIQSGVRVWMIVDLKSSNQSQIAYIQEYAQIAHSYFSETGRHWIHHIHHEKGRRPPPHLHMWSAGEIGHAHSVHSQHIHWSYDQIDQSIDPLPSMSASSVSFQVETLSTTPKIFLIKNFLSKWECLHLRALAKDELRPSVLAESVSHPQIIDKDIRFSSTARLNRKASLFLDTLFHRIGDVLKIDERKLHKFVAAEDIQVVHYPTGGYYRSHLDWEEHGSPASRYISFIMYLNDPIEGGETSFPLGDGGKGFKIHPGEGSVIFFYNLLADGNGDEMVEHATLPVLAGEKWVANLWIWDPFIKLAN